MAGRREVRERAADVAARVAVLQAAGEDAVEGGAGDDAELAGAGDTSRASRQEETATPMPPWMMVGCCLAMVILTSRTMPPRNVAASSYASVGSAYRHRDSETGGAAGS